MKSKLLLILMLLPLTLWAQGGSRYESHPLLKTLPGGSVGATQGTIAVCTQPANTSTQPCSPLATLYTDATLATPCTGTLKDGSVAGATNCSNPLITDIHGNYHFYAATNAPFTLQTYGSGLTTSVEPDVTVPCTGNCSFGAVTAQSVNGDLWVGSGAGQYASMAACYAALTSGQACHVSAGWSETFAANLVLSKNRTGFIFHGNATITMGAFQVTKASTVNSVYIKGAAASATTQHVVFIYTGAGIPFDIGDNANDTASDEFSNFDIDIQGATNSSNVIGMRVRRIQNSTFQSLLVLGTSAASNQIGYVLDAAAGFTGDNTWSNIRAAQVFTGMQLLNQSNNNAIINAQLRARVTGIDLQSGNGNVILNADLESLTTGVNFGASANVFGNRVSMYGQGNTTDFVFGAGCLRNIADNIGANGTTIITSVTDNSGNSTNSVVDPTNIQFKQGGNTLIGGTLTSTGLVTANNGVTIATAKNLSVGRVLSVGAAPSCSVTGAGASGACSAFGTDSYGELVIAAAGAGPAATGTLTITVSAGTLGSGRTICNVWPLSNATAWNVRAAFQQTSTGNTGYVGNWDNNAVALVAANSYNVGYSCFGR